MRVAVKDCILLRRKQRDGHQRFNQLLGNLPATPGRQAGRSVRHFCSALFGERRNPGRTQRRNQARHTNVRNGPIKIPCFH